MGRGIGPSCARLPQVICQAQREGASWVQTSWRPVTFVEQTCQITTLEKNLRMESILILPTCSRIKSCNRHTA